MRILVTGASGFAGGWLVRELASAGHEPLPAPPSGDLDLTTPGAAQALVAELRPDATAHLAAVSFGPAAERDPERAMAVNVAATASLVEALVRAGLTGPVLIASSSEVYGAPAPTDLPITESAPIRATRWYGRSKVEQERAAIHAADSALPIVISRAFNHTGPGQRSDFAIPALARRAIAARRDGRGSIRAGNLDVRRDFSDVRDVARAYRLLLERAAKAGDEPGGRQPVVANVASGSSHAMRAILAMIAAAIGTTVDPEVDPTLVRPDDPPEIVGDSSLLRRLTGWSPTIPFERTIADVVASIEAEPPAPA